VRHEKPALFDYAVASRAHDGAGVSGDLHIVRQSDHDVLVAVVDGLGHGHDAETAARLAISTLQSEPVRSITALVERCHAALSRSRGVVMSLAALDARRRTMSWLAVGNVEGVLIRAGERKRQSILMRGGIVGHRLPTLRTTAVPLSPGDLLVFATDGVREGFAETLRAEAPLQETADRVLARHGRANDDALVLAGRWNGPAAAGSV
jgi:negative regulator of sigma-B (phosphoserine phosphatase)